MPLLCRIFSSPCDDLLHRKIQLKKINFISGSIRDSSLNLSCFRSHQRWENVFFPFYITDALTGFELYNLNNINRNIWIMDWSVAWLLDQFRATNTWFEAIIVEIITLQSRDRVHVYKLTRMQHLNNWFFHHNTNCINWRCRGAIPSPHVYLRAVTSKLATTENNFHTNECFRDGGSRVVRLQPPFSSLIEALRSRQNALKGKNCNSQTASEGSDQRVRSYGAALAHHSNNDVVKVIIKNKISCRNVSLGMWSS